MRPGEVQAKDRRRARAIWAALVLFVLAFTCWSVAKQVRARSNPSTSLTMSDERYPFPDLYVCLSEDNGCDSGYDVDEYCVMSAVTTYSTLSFVVHEYQYYINATVAEDTAKWPGCVLFQMSGFDVGEGDQNRSNPTASSVHMYWSVAEEGASTYSQRVKVYLEDAETGEATAAIHVPYSRILPDGSAIAELYQTDIAIGRIERDFLDADTMNIYQALTISTTTIVSDLGETGFYDSYTNESVVGYVKLHVTEAALSMTRIEDTNPVDIYAIIGNIGGLWEIILLAWGLCFIASRREDPQLKARNFKKSLRRGKEKINKILPNKRPGGRVGYDDDEEDEERPAWDTAANAIAIQNRQRNVRNHGSERTSRFTATSTRSREDGLSDSVDASSMKRPVPNLRPIRMQQTAFRRGPPVAAVLEQVPSFPSGPAVRAASSSPRVTADMSRDVMSLDSDCEGRSSRPRAPSV